MIIKSDLTVTENRACNIQTYRSTNTAERERVFFKRSLHQGTVFSETDFAKGELCSNTIMPRGKSILPQKTEEQVRQNCFFRKRTSPRDRCVQTRSRQVESLSFRGKRKSGSDGTVFSKTDFAKGELCPNTIPPRDKSILPEKTEERFRRNCFFRKRTSPRGVAFKRDPAKG